MYFNRKKNGQQGINPGYCLVVILLLFLLSCQKHNVLLPEYNKVYGGMKDDYGFNVVPASEGGFVIAGTTSSNNGDVSGNHGYSDVWVIKLDAGGNKIWQKAFGGSGNDTAYSITATADGGYAIAGTTTSQDGDVTATHGTADVWIMKIDAAGKLLWQKTFGGPGLDGARSIVETTDGGFAVAGYTNRDLWILKLTGIGNIVWQQTLGGSGNDMARSVLALADGGIAVAGETNSSKVSGNHGRYDMWILRLKENGDTLWTRTLGGNKDDFATGLIQTGDSGFVIVGNTHSRDGNMNVGYDSTGNTSDICLAKIDQGSKIVWVKTFGGTGNDSACSIIATADGGFLIAGQTNSVNGDVSVSRGGTDAWVLKIDAKGNKLWQQSVGGSGTDAAYGIAEIPRKGYVMVGTSSSNDGDVLFNHGGYDILTATFKTDY